jgi:hypothetical protein
LAAYWCSSVRFRLFRPAALGQFEPVEVVKPTGIRNRTISTLKTLTAGASSASAAAALAPWSGNPTRARLVIRPAGGARHRNLRRRGTAGILSVNSNE